jgi:hypothetical protein
MLAAAGVWSAGQLMLWIAHASITFNPKPLAAAAAAAAGRLMTALRRAFTKNK